MELPEYIGICIFLLASIYFYQFYCRGRIFSNPVSLFFFVNALMASGSVALLDFSLSSDVVHFYVIVFGTLSFYMGVLYSYFIWPVARAHYMQWAAQPVRKVTGSDFDYVVLFLALFSVIVSAAYFIAIGYNLFYLMLTNASITDVAGMRLKAYASDQYFAPGYVNQFKNTILPVIALYFLFVLRGHGFFKRSLSFIFLALSVFFLLGTGQRMAFAIFLLTSLFYFEMVYPGAMRRSFTITSPKGAVAVLLSFVLFSLVTVGLSRGSDPVFVQILSRLFHDNQYSSVVAFRYIYDSPITYGKEWLESLMGILPGNRGSDLNSMIFSFIYVSDRGNAPPSVLGSSWHNFGWLGPVAIPFFMGLFFHFSYYKMMSGVKDPFRLACYSGLAVVLGSWAFNGPMYLVNKGAVTLVILLVIWGFFARQRGC